MNGLLVITVLFGFSELVFTVRVLDIAEDGFCLASQFPCSGSACIPVNNVCDGNVDCADGSDEGNCATDETSCPAGEIPCRGSNGTTYCVPLTYSDYSTECRGCGAPPTIANGNVNLRNGNSAFGAWANVVCDDGYESCANMVRCLPSGRWTTATCDGSAPPEPVDECFEQLGECTYNIFAQNIHVALRSSDCDDFCQCTYNTSTTFKWVRSHCSPGTKFDNAINACNHASSVTCAPIECYNCNNQMNHMYCNYRPRETCPPNEQICGQVVEYNSDNTLMSVSKGCMDRATADENLGCTMNGETKVCKDKCVKGLCNNNYMPPYNS